MAELIYPKLSYKIVGILFKVHRELGPGHQEKYYARALKIEFDRQNIKAIQEHPIDLKYSGSKIGRHYLDFLIEDKVVLEIKSVKYLHPKFKRQVLEYLTSGGFELAIIANFGTPTMKPIRVVN